MNGGGGQTWHVVARMEVVDPAWHVVVKAKTMADGRFYEVFADNVGLCVNISADLVDKHAVVQDDGLLWPRSKRCRGGSR